mmetsp:Transcript_37808/g.95865  ORF Transcript_37808/g.95865 Transcript_37808/m.95865 type:complete len:93 (+) Transcript_37808:195-473(+)
MPLEELVLWRCYATLERPSRSRWIDSVVALRAGTCIENACQQLGFGQVFTKSMFFKRACFYVVHAASLNSRRVQCTKSERVCFLSRELLIRR